MRRRIVGAAVVAAAVLLARAALLPAQDDPLIPRIAAPPPLAEALTRRHPGPLRVRLADVRFRTSTGARVVLPEVLLEGDVPAASSAEGPVHLSLLRLVEPLLVMQAGGPEPGIDLFATFGGPRILVERIEVADGAARTLPPVGTPQRPYVWHAEDVDLVLTDVALAGGGADRLRIAAADMRGAVGGRPFRFASLAGTARRAGGRLAFDLRTDLGLSRLALAGEVREGGGATVRVDADTVAFGELRAFQEALPEEGTGRGRLGLVTGGGRLELSVTGFQAGLGASLVRAEGVVVRAPDGTWGGELTLAAPTVRSADVARAFGRGIPGGGTWEGRVALAGTGPALRVDAEAAGVDSAGAASTLTVGGTVRTPPAGSGRGAGGGPLDGLALDLMVAADPVRVADTAFVARLRLEGPVDAVAITGTAALHESAVAAAEGQPDGNGDPTLRHVEAEVDARVLADAGDGPRRAAGLVRLTGVLRGLVEPVPVRAVLEGTVALAEEGAVDAVLRVDSVALPLDTLRVRGSARAVLTGTLRRPRADLTAALRLAGHPEVAATARGTAVLTEGGALDVAVDATDLPLALVPVPADVRDVGGTAAGSFRVAGTLAEPTVEGALTLRDAGFTVPRTGTVARGFGGRVALRDRVARLEGVEGLVGGGRTTVDGSVRLTEEPTLELALRMDTARVMDTDSATLVASAELTAAGPVASPVVGGRVVLLDGRVHEDVLVRRGALDADDPPYAAYVERVPWIRDSRLRRPERPPVGEVPAEGPPFQGSVTVEIRPGVAMVDEDSELRGEGVLTLTPAPGGVNAAGLYRVRSGFYANYGEIFDVRGGAFFFPGTGISPTIALRAEREVEAPLGSGLGEPSRPLHGRFPVLEFFAQGSTEGRVEEVRRLSILPESRLRLARLLLLGVEPGLVDGRRNDVFWLPDEGAGVVGERGAHHAVALLFNYVANEAYDFLPPRRRGWANAGTITVGAGFPTWLTLAPVLQGGVVFGEGEAVVTQPVAEAAPGLRLRWRRDGLTLSVFDEPRFRPVAGSAFPAWEARRRRGVGIRWSVEAGGG